MLTVFEGVDGSGKTTLSAGVAERLGIERIAFPRYESPTGQKIKRHLAGEEKLDPLVFQCLQVANRMETMPRLNAAAGDPDYHIILDRYWASGYVYGQLDGLDTGWLAAVHSTMAQPDLNILVDVSPQTALDRQTSRGGNPSVYEGRLSVMKRLSEYYARLWELHYINKSWVTVDNNGRGWETPILNCSCLVSELCA